MKQFLKPLGNRLLVMPIEAEKVTEGGIIKPVTAEEEIKKASVIEVGTEMTVVNVGDTVWYSGKQTKEYTHEGKKYFVMPETEIIAIING